MKTKPSENGEKVEEAEELCRVLAALNFKGQQILVSPALFAKQSNITLVCDILDWFVKIICPETKLRNQSEPCKRMLRELRDTISTASESPSTIGVSGTSMILGKIAKQYVQYLVTAGRLIWRSIGIKMDLAALFKADESSCGELLKVARLIYDAAEVVIDMRQQASGRKLDLDKTSKKGCDVMRQIAERNYATKRTALMEGLRSWLGDQSTTTIQSAANNSEQHSTGGVDLERLALRLAELVSGLDALLAEEDSKLSSERQQAIDRHFEIDEINELIEQSKSEIVSKTNELRRMNNELESMDLVRLNERLESKLNEIDETKMRLHNLMRQQPTYADELAQVEKLYNEEYELYVSLWRNVEYLKHCVYSDDLSSKPAGLAFTDHLNEEEAASGAALVAASRLDDGDRISVAVSRAEDGYSARVGPASELESLFAVTGASKPMSASLKTGAAGVDGALVGGGGGARVEAGSGATAGEEGRLATYAGCDTSEGRRPPEDAGRRYNGRGRLEPELEGLLSEFAADVGGDSSYGTSFPVDKGTPGVDADEDHDDDEDEEDDGDGDDEEDEENPYDGNSDDELDEDEDIGL